MEGLSYQLAPWAALFRRDEGDAADIATLQRLMRSNDWAADSVRGFDAESFPAYQFKLQQSTLQRLVRSSGWADDPPLLP